MIFVHLKKTDFTLVNWVMTPKRLQMVNFSPTVYVESLASILSVRETVNSKFNLLTTFQPIIWWLLIVSLLIYSLINVRSKNNFLIGVIISMIDHFECLLTKQSELFKRLNTFDLSFFTIFHLSWFTFIKSNL